CRLLAGISLVGEASGSDSSGPLFVRPRKPSEGSPAVARGSAICMASQPNREWGNLSMQIELRTLSKMPAGRCADAWNFTLLAVAPHRMAGLPGAPPRPVRG